MGRSSGCSESASSFPQYRMFMMAVAVGMLVVLWLGLTRTRVGLVIQAALTHPQQVEALGHNVPRVFMLVFGAGSALAGLAGVVGGNAFVTEPAMAGTVGAIVFVVIVVGGLGSLAGAFIAALLIGLLESFGKVSDLSGATVAAAGWASRWRRTACCTRCSRSRCRRWHRYCRTCCWCWC